jgi:hypothetical protein
MHIKEGRANYCVQKSPVFAFKLDRESTHSPFLCSAEYQAGIPRGKTLPDMVYFH